MEQLIYVKIKGNKCSIDCMEKRGDGYISKVPRMYGFAGKRGATKQKREGDLKTPLGLYRIGGAFGLRKPYTNLDWFKISNKSRWCTGDGRYYNSYTDKRWLKNCEDMWKYRKEYRYGFVIEYNMGKGAVDKMGSAIFFHCKTSPTAGCIGVKGGDMVRILEWLNKEKEPHIYICKE